MTDDAPREHPGTPNPEPHQMYRKPRDFQQECMRCGAVVGDPAKHDSEHYVIDTAMRSLLQVLDQTTLTLGALTKLVVDNAASADEMFRRIINREAR